MCQSSLSLTVKRLHESQDRDTQKSAGIGLFWKLDFREMMGIFGLMLLLQTAACLDQFCRFNQSDICYAALGHKLNLLIVRGTSEYDVKIQKKINYNKTSDPVCRVKNGRMKDCDLYSNRAGVSVSEGTLIINRVIRADSGNYTLTFYSLSDGPETSTDLQVNVEAPIGSVEVSIICSSSGTMRASCSSEGDQILYSWTLNEAPLKDGDSSIDLDERTEGNISCRVKNHVSDGHKTVRVKPCPGPTTTFVTTTVTKDSEYALQISLIVLGCVALILLLLFVTTYQIYKKKQVKSTPAAAGNADVLYADISFKKKTEKMKTESLPVADVEYAEIQPQKKRKGRKQREEEVQYGEVMFTVNSSSAHPPPQEECVYSQVHRC